MFHRLNFARSSTAARGRPHPAGLGLVIVLALGGCGKVQEVASEKIAEKALESAITKEGGTASVDLGSQGGVRAQGTDQDGKAYQIELGQAKVEAKDLGVAYYPGATPQNANRMVNGDQTMLQVELLSADPLAKVTDWYRSQLKPRMQGAGSLEQITADEATFMVGSDGQDGLMVNIKAESSNGSRIVLMRTRQGG